VRVIAATHRNLEESIVRQLPGAFLPSQRGPIEMPTLSDRIEDLESSSTISCRSRLARSSRLQLKVRRSTLSAYPGGNIASSQSHRTPAILCPERPVASAICRRYRPADWTAPQVALTATVEIPRLLASMSECRNRGRRSRAQFHGRRAGLHRGCPSRASICARISWSSNAVSSAGRCSVWDTVAHAAPAVASPYYFGGKLLGSAWLRAPTRLSFVTARA
jgi:hypothetical protein